MTHYRADYVQRCPEKRRETEHRYYEANRAADNEKTRRWRADNPERHREHQREWVARNAEAVNARSAAWRAANADATRAQASRRRARKRDAPVNDLTAAEWSQIQAAYGYRCAYCGAKPHELTQDHVVPLSRGGGHTASNVVPACRPCNGRKFTGPAPAYQPLLM
jgi:5-methylcytosine-specific restriction endonuclease McrA